MTKKGRLSSFLPPPSSFHAFASLPLQVFWLPENELVFPHPSLAAPNGLLAVGGDLSTERLVLAYLNGIFPWFEEDGLYYWYSPDPRCVLFPEELRIHKSMRSIFNQGKFRYTVDTDFEAVVRACSSMPRSGQDGTWISESFVEGYRRLHEQGIAHSVEVWQEEHLVGGLYGVSIGKMFFGESMFSKVPNASKAGFIRLSQALQQAGFWMIDCQTETVHLLSLGARSIPRQDFLDYLERNQYERTLIGKWVLEESPPRVSLRQER